MGRRYTESRQYHEGRLVEETGKLKAAEAEVKRRDEYPHPCLICFGVRPASGKTCACNGTNNVYAAFDYLNGENAALRERCRRLEEAGDAMVESECYDWPGRVAAWAAAKGALDAPAAGGGAR